MSKKFAPYFIEWGSGDCNYGYSVKVRVAGVTKPLAWFIKRSEAKQYMEDCWHDERQEREWANGIPDLA